MRSSDDAPDIDRFDIASVGVETAADYSEVENVVISAFGTRDKADGDDIAELVAMIRESPNYIPELSLVARESGRVVGHVLLSHIDLDDNGAKHQVLTLSPISVLPEMQGKGIGGYLIKTALERADRRGEPLVVLEGSPKYYPRFGFEPAGKYGVSIDLPDWAPPEAAMVYALASYMPEIRGHVLYPPAFDEETRRRSREKRTDSA